MNSISMKDLVYKNVQRDYLVKMVNALLVLITVMLVNHLNNVLDVRKEPLILMEHVKSVTNIVINVKMKVHVTDVKMISIFMKDLVDKNVLRK